MKQAKLTSLQNMYTKIYNLEMEIYKQSLPDKNKRKDSSIEY